MRTRNELVGLRNGKVGGQLRNPFRTEPRVGLLYLLNHPSFRAQPLRTVGRCVMWEFLRLRGRDIALRAHGDCTLKLQHLARGHGFDGLLYCFREFYEPGVRSALLTNLEPGFIAYDIGANIGLWTLLMSRLVGPGGSVTAFEPLPTTAARLRANLSESRAQSVKVEEFALGDTPGSAPIFVPGGDDFGSASLAPESEGDETFEVPVVRLDDYWIQTGAPRVNFVKIDAEGSEPRILDGGRQMLTMCRPVVHCEVNPAKLGPLGHRPSDIHAFFAGLGYEPYVWDDSAREFRQSNGLDEENVLFRPISDKKERMLNP
jgi:FkbM family methyltransferase